jgi:NAD(P)-dependent dehydrogenase (short-subunit alcohol dehydrogenase family)
VEETAPEVADQLLALNAAAPIHLTRACLPFMVPAPSAPASPLFQGGGMHGARTMGCL